MTPGPRLTGPKKLPYRQGTPEWFEARRRYITATDIPVLLGISPWKCEQDLADEKLKGNGTESTLVMRVGNALEDLILAAYAEQTGRKARHVRGLWESAVVPWAAASPDATAAGRLVELKWTGSRSRFRDGLPDDVAAQVQWQLVVAEAVEADVATLTVGDAEVRIFRVHADAELQSHLVAIAADFRRRLAEGGPFAQSAESVKRRYPADNGAEMVADASLTETVAALMEARLARKEAEERADALETAIKSRMGEFASLRGPGFQITWKRTKDTLATDWKLVADAATASLPETERMALVGLYTTVRQGFRPLRVVTLKEDAA